ncbi:hypothetical protein BaOVIS_015470 [Babesia ovis]|uniref:RAP domain-containing protein n=1 Tax=Babesia ovis TaxID=5869 RepID=A0A9W5TA95_BABOV|nr:hypothetical protein BaOVIS_015470 [Babesia ovis]
MSAVTNAIKSTLSDTSKLASRVAQSARFGQTDVTLWRGYSNELVNVVHSLEISDVVKILDAYSYMRYRHVKLLDTLATRIYESCFKLSTTDITRVLRAYSILEHRNDFMFRLMLPEISRRLEAFTLGDLTSVFYSYSKLGYYNRNLTACIESAVTRNLHNIRPKELCYVLSALGKLHVRWEKLETVLGCHFCNSVELCSHLELGLIVNALGRLNFCGHPHLFSVVETEVYRKSKNLPPQAFSLVANAISRREESVKALEFLGRQANERLRDFDIHSLCLLSAAFSRRGAVRQELFDRMAERVGRISLCLYPRAVASLTFSYGRSGHLYGPLMLFAGQHLERFIEYYSCNELAMVLRAHSLLNIRNENMLLAIAKYICNSYPDMVPVRSSDDGLIEERLSFALDNSTSSLATNVNKPTNDDTPNCDTELPKCAKSMKSNSDDQGTGDITHINHLEVFTMDPFDMKHNKDQFLQRGLMHSILWIIQSFAIHGLWNEGDVRGALQRIANEVACRQRELTPLTISHMLYAFSKLNYRFDALLDMLILELRNPRVNFIFEQDQLRAAYHAMVAFSMEPSTAGIYQIPTLELKRLMETRRNDIMAVVRAIVENEYNTIGNMENETNLEIHVPFSQNLHELDSKSPSHYSESAMTYVHIPPCVATSVGTGHGSNALTERLKYNFAI